MKIKVLSLLLILYSQLIFAQEFEHKSITIDFTKYCLKYHYVLVSKDTVSLIKYRTSDKYKASTYFIYNKIKKKWILIDGDTIVSVDKFKKKQTSSNRNKYLDEKKTVVPHGNYLIYIKDFPSIRGRYKKGLKIDYWFYNDVSKSVLDKIEIYEKGILVGHGHVKSTSSSFK
jgi:hypothetical protein